MRPGTMPRPPGPPAYEPPTQTTRSVPASALVNANGRPRATAAAAAARTNGATRSAARSRPNSYARRARISSATALSFAAMSRPPGEPETRERPRQALAKRRALHCPRPAGHRHDRLQIHRSKAPAHRLGGGREVTLDRHFLRRRAHICALRRWNGLLATPLAPAPQGPALPRCDP